MLTINEVLRAVREAHGLAQSEAAAYAGLKSHTNWSAMERGEKGRGPHRSAVEKFSKEIGLTEPILQYLRLQPEDLPFANHATEEHLFFTRQVADDLLRLHGYTQEQIVAIRQNLDEIAAEKAKTLA